MDAQNMLDLSDPRLAHIASNPSMSFHSQSLKNHWIDLKRIVSPDAKDIVRVCKGIHFSPVYIS